MDTRKRISGWWLPSGIVLSAFSSFVGLKAENYNSVYPYVLAMVDVLAIYVLFFLYRNEGALAKKFLVPPEGVLLFEKANLWLFAFGAFLFGWLLGDYISLVIGK